MPIISDVYICRSNGKRYQSLLSLRDKKVNPLFFSGCGNVGTNVRPCIKKNGIPDQSLIWVSSTGVSNEKNKKAQPYVTEEYTNEWIMNTERIADHRRTIKAKESAEKAQAIAKKRLERKQYDPTQIEPLPDLIELAEPFFDGEGNELQIEMRGKRTVNGIVFKAIDVQKAFGTDQIYHVITIDTSGFEYGLHYKFYSGSEKNTLSEPQNTPNSCNGCINYTSKKILYLTYLGLIKYLFSSRSAKVDAFQQWAIEKLFVHQLGDQPEKDMLAGELMKETHSTVANLFRRSYLSIPCVYLMRIGKKCNVDAYFKDDTNAPDLNQFDDNDYVYKLGYTNNLERRYEEHVRIYGKWSPSEFHITRYLYIDELYLRKAEAFFKEYMKRHSMLVNSKKFNELVVIPDKNSHKINECFEEMSIKHSSQSEKLAMYRELELSDFKLLKEQYESRIRELETELKHQKQLFEKELLHQKIDSGHMIEKLEIKLANLETMRAMDQDMFELKLFKASMNQNP